MFGTLGNWPTLPQYPKILQTLFFKVLTNSWGLPSAVSLIAANPVVCKIEIIPTINSFHVLPVIHISAKSHLGGVGHCLNATKESFKIPLAICLTLSASVILTNILHLI